MQKNGLLATTPESTGRVETYPRARGLPRAAPRTQIHVTDSVNEA
jgi:hypothetical protein